MKKSNLAQPRKMDRKIRWLFIFSFVAFICFMAILYLQTNRQEATRLDVYDTYSAIKKLERINTLVAETESAARGYLLTKDTTWKKTLALTHSQLRATIKELGQLTHTDHRHTENSAILDSLALRKAAYQNELIDAPFITPELLQKVRTDGEARQITRSIKALLITMIRDEETLLSERIAKNEHDHNTGVYLALFGGIFAFVLVLAVLFQLNGDIFLRKKAEEEVSISESKYRNLIENAGVVVFTADMNGNVTFTNNLVYDLTGYTGDELIGKHFGVLIDPAWMEQVAVFYRHQFQEKKPATTLEFLTRTKSGEAKWVEQFAQLLYEDDRIVGFQCMVKDITEKKNIEFELTQSEWKRKENEYRLTSILDNTTTLIFIKDLEGRYIMVNNRFKEVFGLTDEMVINKTDYDFNSKERADHYKQLDGEVLAGLRPIESEELVETAEGKRNLLLVKFPLLDDKQRVFGISGIATDITERVQSHHALEQALMHAKEAKELQEQFLANMSHEIRTPLNGIQGMTSLLLETQLTDEQKEFTTMIKRSLNNLVAIVNDVLDFSNIKAGKLTLEKIEFNLVDAIDSVKGQFAHQVSNKGLALQVELSKDVPPVLIGDPYRLKQVLVSLVGNAVKFTKVGGITIRVSVTAQSELEAFVRFTIIDTGIGIPGDKLNTIFESFAQANIDISRGYGGVGLGLAISKGLIQVQGGDINVQSIPGGGSEFSFFIPYGLKPKNAGGSARTDNAIRLKDKRFLVVEDNEVNQKLIDFVLKKVGGIVDIASQGQEAIEYFHQGRTYDLVIMDLQMPVMDGYQTATYIRRELKLDIPIIAMTATALKGDQEKCRLVGMNDFMLKPFDFNDLYKRLVRLLFKEGAGIETALVKTGDTTKLYDLSLLEELDDKESLLDVISLFLDNTPQEVSGLPGLLQQGNWNMLYKQAHKIKGAVAILQAKKIAGLLGKIEEYAKEEKNIPQIEIYVNEVITLFATMESSLREEQELIQKELTATK
jgi:PAS domain S-box-containing protein